MFAVYKDTEKKTFILVNSSGSVTSSTTLPQDLKCNFTHCRINRDQKSVIPMESE